MPRLPDKMLDCVCYLYESEDDARAGVEFGGTGFLISMPSEMSAQNEFSYVVTNWHVACRGNSVVRVNTVDGGVDVVDYGPDQWAFDPRYDIAIAPMPIKRDVHRYAILPTEMFLTREGLKKGKFGPGEDVFMVGRFVDHDGGQVNLPAVRFGNLSVMPSPIEQPNGRMTEMFCIDLHSRTGYSGSPVFMYRTPGWDLSNGPQEGEQPKIFVSGVKYLGLLGIHCSQFTERWEISSSVKAAEQQGTEPLITEGRYIKGLSGMTCVLPAWNILEVLNMTELKRQRAAIDAQN